MQPNMQSLPGTPEPAAPLNSPPQLVQCPNSAALYVGAGDSPEEQQATEEKECKTAKPQKKRKPNLHYADYTPSNLLPAFKKAAKDPVGNGA